MTTQPSDTTTGTGQGTGQGTGPTRKAFGHGSKETDVAYEIGAYAGEDKARAARASAGARTVPSRIPGEPPTIYNETIPQMRARVRTEREAAEPTAFQSSLIGRPPAEADAMAGPALGTVAGTLTGTGATGATGATGTGATPSSIAPVSGAASAAPLTNTAGR
jgi:hypothetical protein